MSSEVIDRRPLVVFLVALAALASGFVLVSRLAGVSMILLAPAYMFTPLLAGIVTCVSGALSFERAGLRLPRGRLRWLAIAAVVPLVLILVGTAVAVALPGTEFVPDVNPITGAGTSFEQPETTDAGPSLPGWPANLLIMLVVAVVAGATINAVFAFGEEFGWRGVLQTALAPLGFWRASAVVGFFWGVWHAPIVIEGYNFPNEPVVGVGVMTVACIAMAPVYTYVTLAARSVLAPAVFHGTFNAFAATMLAFAQGGSELVVNPVGGIGILVFGLAAVAIAVAGTPPLEPDWALPADAGATGESPARDAESPVSDAVGGDER
ncbi:CPBP family intramembrane glutamic endopeptidase [Halopiger xanaduensis]|uniref:Abortive infection protein n=1 Tax=Halopiger xanaduensis (strain DSM 18323 / JCM 14033 / SH-6) TaxID=797210 RepID=F8DCK1_HALXS|nr:type II CAAX endopeptidase family protein [Halopiger xanaduensis]AEH36043.1 Abortive infection protein [Halopiger xanaduensis SH-6]